MYFNQNGETCFNDLPEMYYNLYNEIGLAINGNHYLYDTDTGVVLRFQDKYIKTSNKPYEIVYPGRNDIVFEPMKNYSLMASLFGYFIDKEFVDTPDLFVAQFIEDNKDYDKQRVVVRTKNGDIASPFYNNVYLGFCYCIFIISGYKVNLDEFDIIIGD